MEEPAKRCYNLTAMKNQNTKKYSTPIQLKMPVDMERIIEISDPVYTFNEVMDHMDLKQYIAEEKGCNAGRPKYDQIKLLKVILFAFMENGYCSVRMIRKLCTKIKHIKTIPIVQPTSGSMNMAIWSVQTGNASIFCEARR